MALAGVTGWAFAETAAVGWLGIGWGLVAAAIVIQTLRVRSLAASLWTLAGISVLSSVCFGVPVASSAARAASIAALTSAPPSSNFVLWLVVISLVSAAIAVHDGIILRVATAGAAGLDRLGFIGEGQRFGVLSGATALFGITLVETWPGGTETRLIAAAIPMVACGAIAMGEGLLGFVWKAMNRGAGGRPSEALQDRPLAAPRVTHEMTDSVAKAAGMIGKDVVVEQFVPDDQQLGKGEESYAPPLDYEKMAAMVAPRRRSDGGTELQAERTARPAPNVIEAARNPVTSAVAGKPAAVPPAAQAREEVGPLDLWDDEEVAEWETGVSAGQLEAMKQFMSDEEINEYTKNQLAYTKAKLERDEHYRIAGLPEAPVKGALEPSAPAEAPPGEIASDASEDVAFQLVDLFVQSGGPLAEAPYRIIERFKAAPDCLSRVVQLEPRAQAFVDAICAGASEAELEIILMTPAGDVPEVVHIEEAGSDAPVDSPNSEAVVEPISAVAAAEDPVEENIVQDEVIVAAAAEAASSYTAVEQAAPAPEDGGAEATHEPARPYERLPEAFATLSAAVQSLLEAGRKTEGEGAADLEGLLVADPAMMQQFGADQTLVKALLAFSGNDMSYYVVRSAVEMLVRRMPSKADDPMCGVLMQVLRDAPLESFGTGSEAPNAKRKAEIRLALILLRDQVEELVEFCRGFSEGKIDDRDAFEAANAAKSLYFTLADVNPLYARLPGGALATEALEAALSAAREKLALREIAPAPDVYEREAAAILTDDNQRRGMAAALRKFMPAAAREAIDDLCDVGRAASFLNKYLWRRGRGLPTVEAHPLYPALVMITDETVRAFKIAAEAANDARNFDAVIGGMDKDLAAFLKEHTSAGGIDALRMRIERFVMNNVGAEAEALTKELQQVVSDQEALLKDLHEGLEREAARGPVERACDVVRAILEGESVTVQLVDSAASAPARMFFAGADGDVAFVFIDGLGARWRLLGSALVCEQLGMAVNFEQLCAAMPRTPGIGRAGSFRLVVANCAGLETADEPGIVRIEDISGDDDASRVRAARFLKERSDLMTWK